MPETSKVDEVFSAIETTSRVLDVPFAEEKVRPVLDAYGDGIADGLMVFTMAAGESRRGDFDYNFTIPAGGTDPYETAVAHGFTGKTDHPVGSLLSDITARFPLNFYGAECGVAEGFKKTYAFFPLDDLQSASKLAELPSMPPAVGEHVELLARYGLDDNVSIVGIDHVNRTTNLYFGRFSTDTTDPELITALLRDLGLPPLGDEMLEFSRHLFSIYPTFSWDSPRVKRICFSLVTMDAAAVPARREPEIGRFVRNTPIAYEGDKILVFGATLAASGEYWKAGVYHRRPAEYWSKVQLFDKIVNQA
jgi:hypothetical protein